MLHDRFELLTIENLGGIPPGKWSVVPVTTHVLDDVQLTLPPLPLLSPLTPLPLRLSLSLPLLTYSYALDGHGLTTPKSSLMTELIADAFIIAIISFVINISQAKLLAKKNSYSVHPDQVSRRVSKSIFFLCVRDYLAVFFML